MGNHCTDGPAGTGYFPEAADIGIVREINIVLRQLLQFGNQAPVQCAAIFFSHVAGFHGFQHDIDQIPLFFGEGDLHRIGIPIFIIVQLCFAEHMDHIIHQFHIECRIGQQSQRKDAAQCTCYAPTQREKTQFNPFFHPRGEHNKACHCPQKKSRQRSTLDKIGNQIGLHSAQAG